MIEGISRMTTLPISRPAKGLTLRLDQIEIPATARAYHATAVLDLSKSIAAIGLQSALTVIERDDRFVLVAGRHRLEALRTARHRKCSRPLRRFHRRRGEDVDDQREHTPSGIERDATRRTDRRVRDTCGGDQGGPASICAGCAD